MKSKRTILNRITALYVIFFLVIAFGVFRAITGPIFVESFNTGRNDAYRHILAEDINMNDITVFYDMRLSTRHSGFNQPLLADEQNETFINSRPTMADIEIIAPNIASAANPIIPAYIVGLLGIVAYVTIFIILFIIIGSLRRSFKNDNIFRKSNIALVRTIGILLIAASLLFSLSFWMNAKAAAPYLEGSGHSIDTTFPFNFAELVMGILVFVIAEIFNISSAISEEQKLTI